MLFKASYYVCSLTYVIFSAIALKHIYLLHLFKVKTFYMFIFVLYLQMATYGYFTGITDDETYVYVAAKPSC